MAITNPTAALRPCVKSPSEVRRLVQTLGPNPFDIDVYLYKEKMKVEATVYPSPTGKHEIEFPGRRRRVGLQKMVTTAAEEAARKIAGVKTPTTQPAPTPTTSPTSATVPTPNPTPTPAPAPVTAPLPPPPMTTPTQPASAPAIPTTPAQPQRKTPKPRKKKSVAAPLVLIALAVVIISVLLSWLLTSNQPNNNDNGGVSAKQQPQTAISAALPTQPAGAPIVVIIDYSLRSDLKAFDVPSIPGEMAEITPPDAWKHQRESFKDYQPGQMFLVGFAGREGNFSVSGPGFPDLGNVPARGLNLNAIYKVTFICPSATTCPTIHFEQSEQ
jgi:hypothetical protein